MDAQGPKQQWKTNEISLALIEACINAFEHSETKSEVYIHFIISEENLTIKVIDKGKGFDSSKISIPNISNGLVNSIIQVKIVENNRER